MGGTSKVHGEHDQAWEGWICQNPSPLKNGLSISDLCFKIPVHVTPEIDTMLSIPTQVFKLMKDVFNVGACRGSRHWKVCGSTVCGRGFMLMIGIGKGRFQTLAHAARNGEDHCPFDSRYIPKGPRVSDPRREKVHQFLLGLYDDVAEHIPDKLNSNKRPRRAPLKLDPANMDRSTIKHLPAGSINDYFRQCKASIKDETLSRKLFCSEPCLKVLSNSFEISCICWFLLSVCFLSHLEA